MTQLPYVLFFDNHGYPPHMPWLNDARNPPPTPLFPVFHEDFKSSASSLLWLWSICFAFFFVVPTVLYSFDHVKGNGKSYVKRESIMMPPAQPPFDAPSNDDDDNNSTLSAFAGDSINSDIDGKRGRDGSGEGSDTGDVGSLFSAAMSAAGLEDEESRDSHGENSEGGVYNSDHDDMTLDMAAMVAELGRAVGASPEGGAAAGTRASATGRGGRDSVADQRRAERRLTADKFSVDDLLGQIDSPLAAVAKARGCGVSGVSGKVMEDEEGEGGEGQSSEGSAGGSPASVVQGAVDESFMSSNGEVGRV